MELLKQNIEALIFTSETSITADEIANCLKTVYGWELTKEDVKSAVSELKEKYNAEDYAFELVEMSGGFKFLSKRQYHVVVNTLLQITSRKRLSTAALETLAIIGYRQPISKGEIEHLRGVNCDYTIQKLLEKDLIVIEGKSDGPGKPLLYATSKTFMDHFGLNSVGDLPKLKDVQMVENEIGTPQESEDTHEQLPPVQEDMEKSEDLQN